jgi:hypothetical protein
VLDRSAAYGFDLRESELRAERLADEFRRAANDSRILCRQLRTAGAGQPGETELGSCRAGFHLLVGDEPGGHRHLPRREFSCPTHPESGQTPRCLAPFCTSSMLMSSHGRGVQQQVFQVLVAPERLEDSLPDSAPRPSVEPLEYRIPTTISIRQIAPRRAGSRKPQDSVDKTAVVLRRTARIAPLSRKMVFDRIPLGVREFMSSHRLAPP